MERQKRIGSIERPRLPTEINLLLLAMVLALLQLTQAPSLEAQGPQPSQEITISDRGTKPDDFTLKQIRDNMVLLNFRYPGPRHADGTLHHQITEFTFYNQKPDDRGNSNFIFLSPCAEPVSFFPPARVNIFKDQLTFEHRANQGNGVIERESIVVALNDVPIGTIKLEGCNLDKFTVKLKENLPPPFYERTAFIPSLSMESGNDPTHPTVTPTPTRQPSPTPSPTPPQDLKPYHLYVPDLRKEVAQQKGNR